MGQVPRGAALITHEAFLHGARGEGSLLGSGYQPTQFQGSSNLSRSVSWGVVPTLSITMTNTPINIPVNIPVYMIHDGLSV